MKANEFQGEYYNPQDDKYNQAGFSRNRGPRFTLRHLNKLKKMREAKDLESLDRADFMEIIYGNNEAAAGPGGF